MEVRKAVKTKLRYPLLVALIVACLSLAPEFLQFVELRNSSNGATFFYDYDEVVYASYVQSLIAGKPRNNSVYQGEKTAQGSETIFSIQFFPAYLTARLARVLGISSDQVFLFISVICSFFSVFALYWFINAFVRDPKFASVATLFVLIVGPNFA